MKYFRIPIDNYYEAVAHTKRPKYIGAFSSYTATYVGVFCYVAAEVKEKYYNALINKDDVSEFTEEEYLTAINRLK